MKKLVNAIFGISIIATSFTTTSCQKENLQPTYIVDTVKLNQFEDSIRKELSMHGDTIYIQVKDTNKIDYSKPATITVDNTKVEYFYYSTGEIKEEILYEDNHLIRKTKYVYNGKTSTQTVETYDPNTGDLLGTHIITYTY